MQPTRSDVDGVERGIEDSRTTEDRKPESWTREGEPCG